MTRRHRSWLALALTLGLVGACKKEATLAAYDPVVSGIENHGGVEKLKKASSFSAAYQLEMLGAKLRGKLKHKAGAMRMEYVIPYGDRVIQTTAQGQCWQQRGQVIIPCDKATADHASRLAGLLEASWFFPLKERKDRTVKLEQVEQGGKQLDGLTILGGGDALGTLLYDRAAARVVGLKMQTTLMGKAGELVGDFSKFEKTCGQEIATKHVYSFDGKPYLTLAIEGILCEPLADSVFAQPPQVKQDLVKLKHKGTSNLACTKLKGPLTGVGAALGRVRDYLAKHDVPIEGAPVLVHHRGPPEVKNPAGYVTDVCLSVSKKVWVMDKGLWKGEFTLYDDEGDEVLAAFGIGDPAKNTPELAKLLTEGAKIRKRPRNKEPLVQILHLLRDDIPADQQVSEMHAVLQ